MKFAPVFFSMSLVFLWMSYEDWKTGYVYRFQSYLVIAMGGWIYIRCAKTVMYVQLFCYLAEILWLVKKEYLGRGDGYVYTAMSLGLSAFTDGDSYLFLLFIHQLLANLFFVLIYRRQIRLPVFRLGACNAFVPSLFYSWISVAAAVSMLPSSGR